MAIRSFDYGDSVADRYTIIVGEDVFGMSEAPNHPQGFNQYAGALLELWPPDPEQWRGEEIRLSELPVAVLVAIIRRMEG